MEHLRDWRGAPAHGYDYRLIYWQERRKRILRDYRQPGATLNDVATKWGLSKSRVSVICTKARVDA